MNRQRFLTWTLAGMLLLILAPAAQAGWWDSLSDAKKVKLEELIKDPHGWKGKQVSFVCTFHKVSTIFNPYYTRFVPDEYVNFAVWPLSRKLWIKEQYLETHKFLFMEKDHNQYRKLMGLEKFTRVQVYGFVQSSFKGVPWIEVRGIRVLSGGITKDALKCIILGDRAAARKNYQAAMGQYDKAAGMSLPEEVLASVSKKRATTLHRLGKDEMAREALEQALDHDPDDAEARALLLRLKMPSPTPFGRPGDGEVVVKPVDPKKYGKEPKAMPAPKKPAVVEEPAKVEPPAEVGPAKVEPVKPPADKPDVVEDPGKAADEPEVKDDPAEVPEEKEKEEPAGKKKPKKRMAGPM